jgi:hypothetical protein
MAKSGGNLKTRSNYSYFGRSASNQFGYFGKEVTDIISDNNLFLWLNN